VSSGKASWKLLHLKNRFMKFFDVCFEGSMRETEICNLRALFRQHFTIEIDEFKRETNGKIMKHDES
jgi:hypothetical protein